jgi:hypothetical protein
VANRLAYLGGIGAGYPEEFMSSGNRMSP